MTQEDRGGVHGKPDPGQEAVAWLLADLRSLKVPGSRRGAGSNYDRILKAARDALIDVGYSAWSLREVAARSQVHLKTLQCYFRSKGSLLEATLDHTLTKHYYDGFISLFNSRGATTFEDLLEETVRFLVSDSGSGTTAKFFFDLWAMAVRDEDARRAVSQFYLRYRRLMGWLIERAYPSLPSRLVPLRAAVAVAQIEGLMLFLSQDMPAHAELTNLSEEGVRTVMFAIRR